MTKKSRSKFKTYTLLLLFVALWLALTTSYIVIFDESVLVLSYNHSEKNLLSSPDYRLLKNEKIVGEFVGQDKNLGIVNLRFEKFKRIPYSKEDTLIFRIKEKGDEQWYYENEYRSGLTYDVPLLPFGFPIIEDSKDKVYIFELESLLGDDINGVVLSDRSPIIISKYQQSKAELFGDIGKLLDFGYKKFFYSFYTIDIAYSSFVFSLPLLFYLAWISPLKEKAIKPATRNLKLNSRIVVEKILGDKYEMILVLFLKISHNWMFIFLTCVLFIDIFFLQVVNDLLYILVFFLWLALCSFYKKTSAFSIIVGLLILLIAPVFLELNSLEIAEEAGGWSFIFLSAGVVQSIYEYIKKKNT